MKILRMKVLYWSIYLLLAAPLVILTGCTEDNVFNAEADATLAHTEIAQMLGRTNDGVAVPFKADFFTIHADMEGADPCAGSSYVIPINEAQEGYGEATHLGRFTTRMTFCVEVKDWADLTAPYNNVEITFFAANGDELWLTVPSGGLIIPSDKPGYLVEFHTPFEVSGGTGRFEEASGSGSTDSYQYFDGTNSVNEHYYEGTLVLPRGK